MDDKPTDDSNAPRRGSEKRKRGRSVSFRMDDAEYAELVAAAEAAGQTLGTFIRSRVLAAPTTGARRRVSVELHAVGRLLAEVNRLGGNVHQLLKYVNFGHLPDVPEIRQAFAGCREIVIGCLAVLGRTPRVPEAQA